MSADWKQKLLAASQTPGFKECVQKSEASAALRKAAKALVTTIDKGRDAHADKARAMFHVPAGTAVTPQQRALGKLDNHALHYGASQSRIETIVTRSAPDVPVKRKPTKVEVLTSRINSAGKSASAIGVLGSVKNVELAERLADVAELCDKVHTELAFQSAGNKKLVGTRRLAETAINYVNSITSGMHSHEITSKMLPEISKTMRLHLRTLLNSVEESMMPVKPQPTFDQLDERAVAKFKLAETEFNREVGKNSLKAAFVADIPVVPIFDGVVTPERLSAAGLPVSGLGGYPVLLRQRVICVNTVLADKLKYDREEYLSRLIARIEEHSNQGWALVTTTGMANKKHELMMYWIMPHKAISSMTDAAGASLREWGLAF